MVNYVNLVIPNRMDKSTVCPHCGFEISQYQGLTLPDTTPEEGDITICGECKDWSMYIDGKLEVPSDAIKTEMPKEFREDLEIIIKNLKKKNG